MKRKLLKPKSLPRNKSVAVIWLMSYILLIAVQICINAVSYSQTRSIVELGIDRYSQSRLANLKANVSHKVSEAEQLIVNISLDPKVKAFTKLTAPITDDKSYQMLMTVQNLAMYRVQGEYIEDFFVFFKNSNMVLTARNSADSQDFFSYFYEGGDMTYMQWVNALFNSDNKGYAELPVVNNGVQTGKQVAICRQLPIEDRILKEAAVVVLLRQDELLSASMQRPANSDETVFLINEGDSVLAHNGIIDASGLPDYHDLQGESGKINKRVEGKNFVATYEDTGIADWKLVSLVSASVFWNKLTYVRNVTIISIAIVILIQMALAYYFVRRSYRPVRELVDTLSHTTDVEYRSGNNEFSYIKSAVKNTVQTKKNVLRKQEKRTRRDLMVRLLKDRRLDMTEAARQLREVDVVFQYNMFVVGIFYNEDVQALYSEEEALSEPEQYRLGQMILENVVTDLANQWCGCYAVAVEDTVVCLFNLSDSQAADWITALRTVAGDVCGAMDKHFGIRTTAAFGSMHHNLEGIGGSYAEALEAFEHKLLVSAEDFSFYDEINETSSGLYRYSLEEQQNLIEAIKDGKYERSMYVLEQIFDKNFHGKRYTTGMVKCFMVDMIATIIRAVNEIFVLDESNEIFDRLDPVRTLMQCSNVREMKESISSVLQTVCAYVQDRSEKNAVSIRDCVEGYIQEHYSDANLSLSYIGDALGFSPSYLSKLFKQESGRSILDYLNMVRIEKAKELLRGDNSLNLDEIAMTVGYSGRITFTRIFKKYEGITPGVYRESKL